jgi:hypothetical protein
MSQWKLVKASPFENEYGRLELHQDGEGKFFLRMEGSTGGREFGPLSEKQVEAFHTLCDAPELDD